MIPNLLLRYESIERLEPDYRDTLKSIYRHVGQSYSIFHNELIKKIYKENIVGQHDFGKFHVRILTGNITKQFHECIFNPANNDPVSKSIFKEGGSDYLERQYMLKLSLSEEYKATNGGYVCYTETKDVINNKLKARYILHEFGTNWRKESINNSDPIDKAEILKRLIDNIIIKAGELSCISVVVPLTISDIDKLGTSFSIMLDRIISKLELNHIHNIRWFDIVLPAKLRQKASQCKRDFQETLQKHSWIF